MSFEDLSPPGSDSTSVWLWEPEVNPAALPPPWGSLWGAVWARPVSGAAPPCCWAEQPTCDQRTEPQEDLPGAPKCTHWGCHRHPGTAEMVRLSLWARLFLYSVYETTSCLLFIFSVLFVALFFQFRLQENVPEIAFFQEIPQYMATLNSMLNITEGLTDSNKQGTLLNFLTMLVSISTGTTLSAGNPKNCLAARKKWY